MVDLTAPRFIDPDAAREHLEALHWPNGPVCPHCQSVSCKRLPDQRGRPSKRNPEGAIRKGIVQCNGCRQQFTITVGTVFEDSKVPLHKWLLATRLLTSSKKGMSAHQLHRSIGVTYKTAWFMFHRIREAMAPADSTPPLGETGGTVEVDETYIGRRKGVEMGRGGGRHKMQVVALIDRTTGAARAFSIKDAKLRTIAETLEANVSASAHLMTDEGRPYRSLGYHFADHSTVKHRALEYVNKDNPFVHTNTVEGFFSIFKRGMKGIYQHCGEQHLQRYVQEFAFRYSNRIACGVNDDDRAELALKGTVGKRLTYRRTNNALAA